MLQLPPLNVPAHSHTGMPATCTFRQILFLSAAVQPGSGAVVAGASVAGVTMVHDPPLRAPTHTHAGEEHDFFVFRPTQSLSSVSAGDGINAPVLGFGVDVVTLSTPVHVPSLSLPVHTQRAAPEGSVAAKQAFFLVCPSHCSSSPANGVVVAVIMAAAAAVLVKGLAGVKVVVTLAIEPDSVSVAAVTMVTIVAECVGLELVAGGAAAVAVVTVGTVVAVVAEMACVAVVTLVITRVDGVVVAVAVAVAVVMAVGMVVPVVEVVEVVIVAAVEHISGHHHADCGFAMHEKQIKVIVVGVLDERARVTVVVEVTEEAVRADVVLVAAVAGLLVVNLACVLAVAV